MKETLSLRYFCEKCNKHQWMIVDGDAHKSPYNLKCKECKSRYEDVKIEEPAGGAGK